MNGTLELACNSAGQLRMHSAALLNRDCLAQVFELLCSWTAQIVLPVVSEYDELEGMGYITRSGRQMPHVAQSGMGRSSA